MKKSSVFIGLAVFIALGVWAATQVKFSFNLTAFAAKNSDEYKQFESYSQNFPRQDDWLVVGFDLNSPISEYETFLKYLEIVNELDSNEVTQEVHSIHSVKLPERSIFGVKKRSLLSWDSKKTFDKKFSRLSKYPDVTSKFLGKSDKQIRLYLKLNDLNTERKNQFIEELYSLKNKSAVKEVYLVGKDVFSFEAQREFPKEMMLIGGISISLLLLLFLFFFGDFRSLIITAILIAFNLSFVMIAFWLTGISIGILTLTVPILIVVLSFSDIIHFLFQLKLNNSKENRVQSILEKVKGPILWTSITTGLGFAVFVASSISEIQEFALVTCIGIIGAFLSARFILPALSSIIKIQPFRNPTRFANRTTLLIKIQNYSKWKVSIGMIILIVVSWSTFQYLSIDMKPDFEKNKSKVSRSMAFFDENFEGTRSIEVIIEDKEVLSLENIQIVDKIEAYLKENYGCSDVFSVNTAVKRLNRFNHFGKSQFYSLPEKLDQEFLIDLESKFEELGLENMVTSDNKILRIIGRLKSSSLQEIQPQNEKLTAFLDQFKSENRTIFISGNSFVNDQTTFKVTKYVLQSLIVAILMAIVVISILFRSFKLIIAILIVNVLPILFATALMVWLQIDLNPYTVMALSIILGISVDDTIYFIKSFVRSIGFGKDPVEISIRENAFPIFFTSLILSVGFATLALSSFGQNRDMGILVSLVLVIAMLSDLILLPALLKILFKK